MASLITDNSAVHKLVKHEDVEIALRNDKGAGVTLESFKMKDFTNQGDNYACIVSSVEVKYSTNGRTQETTYVVKLNPQRPGLPPAMMKSVFERETGFYEDILPQLNPYLVNSGEPRLKVPKHFHSVKESGSEVIFMEDLRKTGYRMHPRHEALDKNHTLIIIKEMARLHASSFLFLNREEFRKDKERNLEKKYPYTKNLMKELAETMEKIEAMFTQSIKNAGQLIDKVTGYDFVVKYLDEKKDDIFQTIMRLSQPKEPFVVLCHGDFWNNNFLFRYNARGEPVDCRLVDLQAYKVASGSSDLNHFLYTSLSGECRKPNLQSILECYYATFASVLCKAKVPMPLTLGQMKKDFHENNPFGLLMAISVVPTVLLKPEDAPKIEDFMGDDMEESMKRHGEKVRILMADSPYLRPRLLDALDEFREYGLFNTRNVSNMIRQFSVE